MMRHFHVFSDGRYAPEMSALGCCADAWAVTLSKAWRQCTV